MTMAHGTANVMQGMSLQMIVRDAKILMSVVLELTTVLTVSASIFKVLGSVDAIQDISYGENFIFYSKTMKFGTNTCFIPTMSITVDSNENVLLRFTTVLRKFKRH